MKTFLSSVFVILLLAHSSYARADSVANILSLKEPPAGVVFEIVSGRSGLLGELLPDLNRDIEKLRERFPHLPVAVVTHGWEQFDLISKNKIKYAKTHSLVEQWVTDNKVDVHVCGTHAEWRGITPEDFPDYVDVAAVGPTQIHDYVNLGYELIVLP